MKRSFSATELSATAKSEIQHRFTATDEERISARARGDAEHAEYHAHVSREYLPDRVERRRQHDRSMKRLTLAAFGLLVVAMTTAWLIS